MSPEQTLAGRLAALEPTDADMAAARRLLTPVSARSGIGSVYACGFGAFRAELDILRTAALGGDMAAVARVVRQMTALERVAEQLLTEELATLRADSPAVPA